MAFAKFGLCYDSSEGEEDEAGEPSGCLHLQPVPNSVKELRLTAVLSRLPCQVMRHIYWTPATIISTIIPVYP